MEGIKKAMNERYLYEGQWEDRKQWNLGVGQRGRLYAKILSSDTSFATVTSQISAGKYRFATTL
jgi:hypothetical protein